MKKEIRVKCTRCERNERSRGGGKNKFQQINIKSNILSTLSKQISLVTSFLQDGGLRL